MKFIVTIDCDSADFTNVTNDEANGTPNPGPEVARLLRITADKVENGHYVEEHRLTSTSGAYVGLAHFVEGGS